MNFVDVQPASFLDYAWTSPSPAPVDGSKPSRTSRKQNRSCDQCRKGKRACNAEILEDTLLGADHPNKESPTVFHYSDVYGPLAPCSNCSKSSKSKIKKECTFDWLRAQRISQAVPQSNPDSDAKRRRKSGALIGHSKNRKEGPQESKTSPKVYPGLLGDTTLKELPYSQLKDHSAWYDLVQPGCFEDMPSIDTSLSASTSTREQYGGLDTKTDSDTSPQFEEHVIDDQEGYRSSHDSGHGTSIDAHSQDDEAVFLQDLRLPFDGTCSKPLRDPLTDKTRKRRRRSSTRVSPGAVFITPSLALPSGILSSTNNSLLAEGLLKLYHDSFENALSCWLTETTCPYSKSVDVSLPNDMGPDWNRTYHRVFKLDQVASGIRGRKLTFVENKTVEKAVNLSILAFALQWAQESEQRTIRYPFRSSATANPAVFSASRKCSAPLAYSSTDLTLLRTVWYEARRALQEASGIESFRLALAQIVFSLAERPLDISEDSAGQVAEDLEVGNEATPSLSDTISGEQTSDRGLSDHAETEECGELLSRLEIAIESDGPPLHLEQGLRLLHSLRSRIALSGTVNRSAQTNGILVNSVQNQPDSSDKATMDLLFWLGVMFDTMSSAILKRPLVVSEEDSDIYSKGTDSHGSSVEHESRLRDTDKPAQDTDGLWDTYLFTHQHKRLQSTPTRWPCSFAQASSLLCDAAPVKVLLFRKVTRIQTLLSRNAGAAKLQKVIDASLEVVDHWKKIYAPFVRDCVNIRGDIPPRIRSWCLCVAGHWHLAVLLLADLVEIVDALGKGSANFCGSDLVTQLRSEGCCMLSDIAKCACPVEAASSSNSEPFHFPNEQGSLLKQPWTAILIRAFAKAGVLLLDSDSSVTMDLAPSTCREDTFRRADDCIRALWYLGRRSNMALAAAKILGDALKHKKKRVVERVDDISSFLDAEMWDGLEGMDSAFQVDCH